MTFGTAGTVATIRRQPRPEDKASNRVTLRCIKPYLIKGHPRLHVLLRREGSRTQPRRNHLAVMRDNWLSDRIVKAYNEIVAICREAWNKLIDQPWRIMSIGMRDWAHGS